MILEKGEVWSSFSSYLIEDVDVDDVDIENNTLTMLFNVAPSEIQRYKYGRDKSIKGMTLLRKSDNTTTINSTFKAHSNSQLAMHTSNISMLVLPPKRTTRSRDEIFNVATVNENNTTNKLILKHAYTCGYSMDNLARELFPDYSFQGEITYGKPLTAQDVLLFGMFGMCHFDIKRRFPGKIVFLNGESREEPRHYLTGKHYRLGPMADDGTSSIQLHYLVAFLINRYPPFMWSLITDPHMRRQSTMEHKAVIYTSSHCVEHRQRAAEEISRIIPVVFGGRCVVPTVVSSLNGASYQDYQLVRGRKNFTHNYDTFSKFQFCLVMENVKRDGYITEKLLLAYLGGCLPIYWGTEQVLDLFHPESFVYYDIENPQPALQLLAYLYGNETAYQERLRRPILRRGKETIEQYFSISDKVGNGTLKRRIREMMGLEVSL